ncbi:DUF397 domain-containing protein [Streptomyces sp. NPDC001985]|uniref:DUF397 domain-containing protein n=1 Tax=Streptomyces sp. NPDC001985 TaxID=3154406 RepID=UPI00331EACAD
MINELLVQARWFTSTYSNGQGGQCVEVAQLDGARWFTSSYSNNQGGQCVEVAQLDGARWFTSTYSNNQGGECVEAARLPDAIAVRDTKLAEAGPAFVFAGPAWTGFLTSLKAGDL